MVSKGKEVKKVVKDEIAEKTSIMIRALEDMPLTEWEQDFVSNVSDWFFGKEKKLSDKQYETLERIYRKFF